MQINVRKNSLTLRAILVEIAWMLLTALAWIGAVVAALGAVWFWAFGAISQRLLGRKVKAGDFLSVGGK